MTDNSTPVGGLNRRRFVQAAGTAVGGLALGAGTASGRTGFAFETTDYTIESFDGTELGATLYTPSGSGPFPAVLMTHGWGAFRQSPLTVPKAAAYARAGYAVLTYDSRGFGESGGVVGLDGPNEVGDARWLIDWLARRPEVALEATGNPKLGMDGVSYAGGIQFAVAAVDERVDAIVPRITWNDLRYSLAPNGVIKDTWLVTLLGLGTVGTTDFDPETRVDPRLYDWTQETLWTNEVPEAADEAFRRRSVVSDDDFDTPTYLVQGWGDTLFKPTEAVWTYRSLQDRGVDSGIAFYEGGHAIEEISVPPSSREFMNDLAVSWMDRHVRGEDRDVPGSATYLKQPDEWRTAGGFPPAETAPVEYRLGDASRDGEDTIERFSWHHDETVTYRWRVATDCEVYGTPRLDLCFDVPGPEARVFCNLQRNGNGVNNVGEAYRVEGPGTTRVSFEYPTLQRFLSPGDTLGLRISLESPLYAESRESEGLTVRPAASRLLLPQRPR